MLKTYDTWKKIRLKHISKSIGQYGANLSTGNYLENGVRFLRTTDIQDNGELIESELGAYVDKSLVQDYLLKHGDILFSRSGTLGRSYLHTNKVTSDFAFAGYLVRFNINSCTHPKFIFYISKSSEFLAQIEADAIQTTISNFNGEKYGNIKISIPPLETQKAIAHFLDRKTAAIDTLIAKKQCLIQLLEEKRTALINQAVTKGLNNVETLEAIKLKHLKIDKFQYGANESSDRNEPGEPRYIRITDLNDDGSLRQDTCKTLALEIAQPYLLTEGDILLARSGATVGKSFLYSANLGKACFAGYLIRLRLKQSKALPKFIWYYTQSSKYKQDIELSIIQATIQNVNAEKYGEFRVTLPTLKSQQEIITFLECKTTEIGNLITKTLLSIEKLQEYRRSHITAAVTGKLDITQEKTP